MKAPAAWIVAGSIAAVILLWTATGCVELKYSAANRLDDPIDVLTSRPPSSVYFSFSAPNRHDAPRVRFISGALASALGKEGLALAEGPDAADIVMTGRCTFYRKAQGSFLFILVLPIYRFNEDYDGISLDLRYQTDKGRWKKTYRVYYRGWLADDFELAVDHLCKAIVADLPRRGKVVEKSQNKAEPRPLQ
ncbi:MAG TPA: hypothetical protein PLJ26_03475 [Candidatus Omnitrophota bacterium]|nr:hypothetical protein [Candidatus Omnitrophota bacterium]HQJ15526.1 hypothetical protein [Candidatus Omnitrophota bacterium]